MENQTNWLLWELIDQISPNDYIAWAVSEIPNLQQQDKVRYEYNQGWSSDCTLYASITSLGATMNYKFSDSDFKEIKELSIKQWKPANDGRYLWKAVDCVRNWWNAKYPERKVVSVQIQMLSEASKYWEKWYLIATTFKGNKIYWADKNDNGVVNGVEFKPSTFWHATTTIYDKMVKVVDSYFWNKYNVYWLPNYSKMVDKGTFSGQGYVFLATTDEKKLEIARKSRLLVLLKEVITLSNDKYFNSLCEDKIKYINRTV